MNGNNPQPLFSDADYMCVCVYLYINGIWFGFCA